MTTGGGMGMEFGDDYVAARLSIEVPTEGISGIREIREEVDRFRTSMEMATRAEADMSRYLGDMAENSKRAAEAQSNLVQQAEQLVSLQARMGGGLAGSSGVPAGTFQQPFSGMSAGMGLPTPPGSRMPNPSDVVYQLNSASGRSPREYLNMQAARGNVTAADAVNISPGSIQALADKIAEREKAQTRQAQTTGGQRPIVPGSVEPAYGAIESGVQGGAGLAGQVMNEIGPGGSHMGMANLALRGLNWVRDKASAQRAAAANVPAGPGGEAPSGGGTAAEAEAGGGGMEGLGMLSNLGRFAGPVGIGLAAAIGGFELVQKGGEMVQGWRNMAAPRGGAGGEGFKLSAKQRLLSMDPMINSQQSREIYQSMLSEGYANASGGGADDIKDFMVSNMKNFNMSAADSVNWLRTSAKGTEIALGDVSTALQQLKIHAGEGWQSLGDLNKNVLARTNELIGQGVPHTQALMAAQQSSYSFQGNEILSGSTGKIPMTPQSNAAVLAFGGPGGTMANLPAGLLPSEANRYLQYEGKGDQANYSVAQKWANIDKTTYHDTGIHSPGWFSATGMFFRQIQSLMPGSEWASSQEKSDELYNQFAHEGKTADQLSSDDKKANTEQHRQARDDAIPDMAKKVFDKNPGAKGEFIKAWTSGGLGRIAKTYEGGLASIEVMKDGKKVGDLDVKNAEQLKGLNDGSLQWRHKGDKGAGIDLADTPESISKDFSTDRPFTSAGTGEGTGARGDGQKGKSGVSGSVHISLSDDAKKILRVSGPNPIPLTPNQAAANSGQGNSQVNNPPPGDMPIPNWWGN